MDRTNYARYGSIYLNDMLGLEKDFPEIYQEFKKGNFVVKTSDIADFAVSPTLRTNHKSLKKKY